MYVGVRGACMDVCMCVHACMYEFIVCVYVCMHTWLNNELVLLCGLSTVISRHKQAHKCVTYTRSTHKTLSE